MDCFADASAGTTAAIVLLDADGLDAWLDRASERQAHWVREHGFGSSRSDHLAVPDDDGGIATVLVRCENAPGTFALGALPSALPSRMTFSLEGDFASAEATRLALGWALGSYGFDRYRKRPAQSAKLVPPPGADMVRVAAVAQSVHLGRDLINTPAQDMGPAELADAAAGLARTHGAGLRTIVGDDLLAAGYPAIHAVGRASVRAPRLIDLAWGDPDMPKITLAGKGVCFDSGGLDLKPAAGMKLMKKDMGGAACALALARMIMRLELPVRLRVLIPAVENSVSGNAYRPLDVVETRKGLSIEIGDTDAEGRVVLCDVLAEASSESPDLLIDLATLTGAARVALGTELPALFSNDDVLAGNIEACCREVEDDVWRLPLWPGYRKMLGSDVAELSTTGSGTGGGAITAALFLERFVDDNVPWAHVDLMAWNLRDRPGRPKGGEVMAARGLLELIERHHAG